MPVERTEVSADDVTFTAELQLPAGDSDHGALLLPGANHTAFDDAVFDRLASRVADAGIQFLRYQTWDSGEELAAKSDDELAAEVDAALEHLQDRGCTRVELLNFATADNGCRQLHIASTLSRPVSEGASRMLRR